MTHTQPTGFTDACFSKAGPQGKLGDLFTCDILQLMKVLTSSPPSLCLRPVEAPGPGKEQ